MGRLDMNLLQRYRRSILTFIVVLSLPSIGCVYTMDDDVRLAESPSDDETYQDELQKATKSQTVYKDFETRFRISATYLSANFRDAFAKRHDKVYMQGQVKFEEAASKAGFFVSIYSPLSERMDLANKHHWTILLKSRGGEAHQPSLVKKLNDKERWRAFFDHIDKWTTEFLVVFESESAGVDSAALLEQNSMNLTFANADAQVSLSW